jgi:hypothetical protein
MAPKGQREGVQEAYLLELEGKRNIACLQLMAYEQLSSDYGSLQGQRHNGEEAHSRCIQSLGIVIRKLQTKLLSISELFNDVSMPYRLWDVCLLLMHTTHTHNPQLGLKLIRSIVFRIIPDHADTSEGQAFLAAKRVEASIFRDQSRQQRVSPFESTASWIDQLTDALTSLGGRLQGPGGDFPIPLAFFVEELEEVAAAAASSSPLERGWTVSCLRVIGFSHSVIVDSLLGTKIYILKSVFQICLLKSVFQIFIVQVIKIVPTE